MWKYLERILGVLEQWYSGESTRFPEFPGPTMLARFASPETVAKYPALSGAWLVMYERLRKAATDKLAGTGPQSHQGPALPGPSTAMLPTRSKKKGKQPKALPSQPDVQPVNPNRVRRHPLPGLGQSKYSSGEQRAPGSVD